MSKGNYRNNKKHGEWKNYSFSSGKLKEHGEYQNGNREGNCKFFNTKED